MTPKREAYLAKCGNNEKTLRAVLDSQKQGVKTYKHILNNDSLMSKAEIEYVLDSLRNYKRGASFYRHELNRLKGMDRVVVPRQAMIFASPNENFNVGDMLGRCKCGQNLDSALMKFCPNCGKHILWGKVK